MSFSPIQKALYAALLSLDSSSDLEEAERLWLREFAVHLITELAVLKSEAEAAPQPEEAASPEEAAA